MAILAWVGVAFATAAMLIRLRRSLQMLQLDGYRVERYLRHAREQLTWREAVPVIAFLAIVALAAGFESMRVPGGAYVVVGLGAAKATLIAWVVLRQPSKTPLVSTARLKRLAAVSTLLALGADGLAVWAIGSAFAWDAAAPGLLVAGYATAGTLVLAAALFVVLAALLLEPFEALVRRRFVDAARRRLAEVRPLVIGVAGSYGKTTTKSAVAAAISARYRVLATPESYNTLLGVTRTVNELLTDDIQAFVVEMGARQPGDIAEICDLVGPEVGVVTRLGPQHLEYFKDEATIVRTKTELLRALPADGVAVVDADGIEDFLGPHDWEAPTTRVSCSADSDAHVVAGDIVFSGEGTSFTVRARGRAPVPVRTRLLGRHAAADCALALTAALELGVDAEQAAAGLAALEPVPHRLEIVRSDTVVVIDDAYNSNPEGFSAALEVLASFPGRRILITPGMVELGDESVAAHRRIGAEAAGVCDIIILVGRSWPAEFMDAILSAGFPAAQLHGVASLGAASELLAGMVRTGDVVLFENDLPDNFA